MVKIQFRSIPGLLFLHNSINNDPRDLKLPPKIYGGGFTMVFIFITFYIVYILRIFHSNYSPMKLMLFQAIFYLK